MQKECLSFGQKVGELVMKENDFRDISVTSVDFQKHFKIKGGTDYSGKTFDTKKLEKAKKAREKCMEFLTDRQKDIVKGYTQLSEGCFVKKSVKNFDFMYHLLQYIEESNKGYPEKTKRLFLELVISGHGGGSKYRPEQMIEKQRALPKIFSKKEIVNHTQAAYLISSSLKQIRKLDKLLRNSKIFEIGFERIF